MTTSAPMRLGVQHLLARHLVGNDQQRAVALASADQRETEPGIAGGGFDDGAAGLEPAVGLRRLDHGARRPVLERARRVCAFELEKQPARATIDARHLDERRVADEVEDRGHAPVYARGWLGHGSFLLPARDRFRAKKSVIISTYCTAKGLTFAPAILCFRPNGRLKIRPSVPRNQSLCFHPARVRPGRYLMRLHALF